MPAGFLIVFSEPGEHVSLDEFQDWYNNEHVPLRMNHLPSFLTGARFSAADALKPSWAALYDIDDTSTFQKESYTRLRKNRSPREIDLVMRLEVLDRRTCEVLSDSGQSESTSSLASHNPTTFIVTHGVNLGVDRDFNSWMENAFELLRGAGGWLRTRSFKYIDTLKTGTAVAGRGPEEQVVPEYLVIHELEDSSISESPKFMAVIQALGTEASITELRKWNLYRAYPGITQGNVGG